MKGFGLQRIAQKQKSEATSGNEGRYFWKARPPRIGTKSILMSRFGNEVHVKD